MCRCIRRIGMRARHRTAILGSSLPSMPSFRWAEAPKVPCACRLLSESRMPEAPAVRLIAVGAGAGKGMPGCTAAAGDTGALVTRLAWRAVEEAREAGGWAGGVGLGGMAGGAQ